MIEGVKVKKLNPIPDEGGMAHGNSAL